ncbi:MAG: DEAD/DEAH box helicase [Longimicrobiales bacterium]
MASSHAFDLLDPRIQKWVWDEGWSTLREVQERAIPIIMESDDDVVIGSATASGKTEAAFLPLAGQAATAGAGGLRILCISPLKALINDQYDRLEQMFEVVDEPVWRWHGDVSASQKKKLREDPRGLLIITPESLEALFIRRANELHGLFAGLIAIVVDELHAFMDSERGRQLQSLLARVEHVSGTRIRRIALSATLGDMRLTRRFLRPGGEDGVREVVTKGDGQALMLQVRGYEARPPRIDELADRLNPEMEDLVTGDVIDISRHIYETFRGGRHLIFANRRMDVETYADLLRRRCERGGVPNEFFPHHGSLAKTFREDVERILKEGSRPATAIATTTLELGVDIGSVESIGQIGPPMSVASLRQRLGRSGRRGDPAVLRIYVQENQIHADTAPHDQLRASLLQAIAMVILLTERWYEPPRLGARHLSTLVQQTLSSIAQYGGITAKDLWVQLCRDGAFREIPKGMFGELLRDLAAHDLIGQMENGELVLGLTGERLVNHYEFYAAFTSAEEYQLYEGGRSMGTLPISFPLYEGLRIIFAGRRWTVLHVDQDKKRVDLEAAQGGRAPTFGGSGAQIHGEVRRMMRKTYLSERVPAFLNPGAKELLEEARDNFRRLGLHDSAMVRWGDHTVLLPWCGDVHLNTLLMMFRSRGIVASMEPPAIVLEQTSPDSAARLLEKLVSEGPPDPYDLAAAVKNKESEKHHPFLGPDLLGADYASSQLDADGIHDVLAELVPAAR